MANQSAIYDLTSLLAELGQRIACYRLNQNLTQQDLAREAGVGVNTGLCCKKAIAQFCRIGFGRY